MKRPVRSLLLQLKWKIVTNPKLTRNWIKNKKKNILMKHLQSKRQNCLQKPNLINLCQWSVQAKIWASRTHEPGALPSLNLLCKTLNLMERSRWAIRARIASLAYLKTKLKRLLILTLKILIDQIIFQGLLISDQQCLLTKVQTYPWQPVQRSLWLVLVEIKWVVIRMRRPLVTVEEKDWRNAS